MLSKCVAGRQQDLKFAETAIDSRLADPRVLLERIPSLPVGGPERTRISKAIDGILIALDRT